ncbi:MAG: hypothetical protein Q9221_002648 [Calogaya cf. arnoldii]
MDRNMPIDNPRHELISSRIRRRHCLVPAEKHNHLFQNVKVMRIGHFNQGRERGASWKRNEPQQRAENVQHLTDDGYHIGHNRRQPGNHCLYEEDVDIPLVIRSLNVPKNQVTGFVISDTGMGWRRTPKDLDGKAIPINGDGKGNEH